MKWGRKKQRSKAAAVTLPWASPVPSTYSAQRRGTIARTFADVSFVYEVVEGIVEMATTIPLKVFEHLGDETAELPEHPASLLLRRPAPRTGRAWFTGASVGDLCIHGNAFWLKVRIDSGAPPVQLIRLAPARMTPITSKTNGELVAWLHQTEDGSPNDRQVFPAENIVHIRNWSPVDDYIGQSPIAALRYEVELGRDAEFAGIDLFQNSMTPHLVFEHPGSMDDEALERLAADLRATLVGHGNRYRVPILEEGMTAKALSLSPADAEFVGMSNLTRVRVAAAYGWWLPDMFAGKVTTPADLRRARFADAVLPKLTLIEESLEAQLMPEWKGEAFPQYLSRHILEPDLPERFAAYKDGIYAGWLPPEWVQRLENIPSGMTTYIPLNMSQVDADGNLVAPPSQGNDTTGGMGGDQGQGGPTTGEGNARGIEWWETKARVPEDYLPEMRRALEGESEALERRLVGVYRDEERKIADLAGLKSGPTAGATVDPAAIMEILGISEEKLTGLLHQFAQQAAERGARAAGGKVTMGTLELLRTHVGPAVGWLNGATGTSRSSEIRAIFDKVALGEYDVPEALAALEARYATVPQRCAVVARTEVAWATNRGARDALRAAGVTELQWFAGPGPCETGICPDMDGKTVLIDTSFGESPIGGTFDGEITEPPAHPSCMCVIGPA